MYAVIMKLSQVAYEVFCNVSQVNLLLNATKCLFEELQNYVCHNYISGILFLRFHVLGIF